MYEGGMLALVYFHDPVGHYRHKGLSQEIGDDHAEPDGQSQRKEEGNWGATHRKGRGKNGQYAKQDQQLREGYFLTGIPDRQSFRFAHVQVLVNIFYRHRTLIYQDPDGQRKPAKSHDIDRLAKKTQKQYPGDNGRWNGHDHDQ